MKRAFLFFALCVSALCADSAPKLRGIRLKPPAPEGSAAPSYPSGATHYWAFENNLTDGVGSFHLANEGVDSFPSGKHNLSMMLSEGGLVSTDANSLPTDIAFSFVTWVFVPTGADFEWTSGTGPAVRIAISGGDFIAKIGTTATTLVGPSVVFDAWHLLVITYDGSSVENLSVDGGTFVSGTTTVEGASGPSAWVGVSGTPSFDESAFFARALTQQEVTDVWDGGTGRFGP